MSETQEFTDHLPDGLPGAAALIEQLRAAPDPERQQAIIAPHPALGLLAPVPVLAAWLGVKEQSVYMARTRTRPDGSRAWPDEDGRILGRKMWRFSTIALHRAAAPGRGWTLRRQAAP